MRIQTSSLSKILSDFNDILSDRQREVVEKRYGLSGGKPMTLDAIGKQFSVTRERIRQIEFTALQTLKKNISDLDDIIGRLKGQLDLLGYVRREEKLLEEAAHSFSDDSLALSTQEEEKTKMKNNILFLLDLAPHFNHLFEKSTTHSIWHSNEEALKKVVNVHKYCGDYLKKAKKPLQLDEYQELVRKVAKEFGLQNENTAVSYLDISKEFGFNPFHEFGFSNWSLIKPTSVSTKAYLVMKKGEKPMHFSEIAEAINAIDFNDDKVAQPSTVHNELIKKTPDNKFVLIGRGLYALDEWGYVSGTVKELLIKFLVKKPKTFKELVEEFKAQRQVKDATILINLQDKNVFTKTKDGKYALKK